jgi:hypothetical protein
MPREKFMLLLSYPFNYYNYLHRKDVQLRLQADSVFE